VRFPRICLEMHALFEVKCDRLTALPRRFLRKREAAQVELTRRLRKPPANRHPARQLAPASRLLPERKRPKRATQLKPATTGNRLAATHHAVVTRFTPGEVAEIAELEDEIRAACPFESPSVEPAVSVLAGLLWRRAKLYAYLNE
jgi:hypothetical protein